MSVYYDSCPHGRRWGFCGECRADDKAGRPSWPSKDEEDEREMDRERDERATGMTWGEIQQDQLLEEEMGRGGPCP